MEPYPTVADVIRKYFSDFVLRNRKAVEEVLADDFVFHSPHDPQINKEICFEKCWPNGENYRAVRIEKLFHEGDEAFVRYEFENKNGLKFRITEFVRVQSGQIKEIEVYYGSPLNNL